MYVLKVWSHLLLVISTGIQQWEFSLSVKDFSMQISQLVQVGRLESGFCVSCASYIATLLTIDNGPCFACEILWNWLTETWKEIENFRI